MSLVWMAAAAFLPAVQGAALFNRISTFSICEQIDPDCNTDDQTNAETVWHFTSSTGGMGLVYTDSESEQLGFVDITDPTAPQADGTVSLAGEPTTVRVIDDKYGAYHEK